MNTFISSIGLDHAAAFLVVLFIASAALMRCIWVVAFVVAAWLIPQDSSTHYVTDMTTNIRGDMLKAGGFVVVAILALVILHALFGFIKTKT